MLPSSLINMSLSEDKTLLYSGPYHPEWSTPTELEFFPVLQRVNPFPWKCQGLCLGSSACQIW